MRKILLVFIFALLICGSKAEAQTIKVLSLQHFSTEFPLPTCSVESIEKANLGNGIVLEIGTIISGRVVRIEKPHKFKRRAYFEFVPTLITYKGKTQKIDPKFVARVVGLRSIDPQKAAVYVAKKATNFIFIGASTGISFVEGLMEAEEGYRLKSGLYRAYKDTPISYLEAGEHLEVDVGDTLLLKIKSIR